MPYSHYIIFSYDQENTDAYTGNFRVDLLKSLLTLTDVDTNSFVWRVATTFTFTIINETSNRTPISRVISKLVNDNLEPHLNYHVGELKHFTDGNPAQKIKSDTDSQANFQDDVQTAKNQIEEAN